MSKPSEKEFENNIVESLRIDQKYIVRSSSDYDPELCLDAEMLFDFILSTQLNEWNKLKVRHGDEKVKEKFLDRLTKVIKSRGTLDVLRKGVKDSGCRFDLIYFKPETELNEEHQDKFRENRFSVIRQLYYSKKKKIQSYLLTFVFL